MADPTPDLVVWLRGVLAEDEDELRTRWRLDEAEWALPECGTRDALLADIAAKRALLDDYDEWIEARKSAAPWSFEAEECGIIDGLADAIRILASAYRSRPGYRPEWAP